MRHVRLGLLHLTLVSDVTHEHLAPLGAASTGALTLAAWLADIEIYLRVGAAAVGIVVGIFTALYYYEAWVQKRAHRK